MRLCHIGGCKQTPRYFDVSRFGLSLADYCGFDKNLFLPSIWLIGLALLDAQRLEHGDKKAVAVFAGFGTEGLIQPFPVGKAARL